MELKKFVNAVYNSNTYAISLGAKGCWLVDCGYADVNEIIHRYGPVHGVFLTHYHYDHIAGLNDLLLESPDCVIFGSQHTLLGLRSSKINLSFYRGAPTEVSPVKTRVLRTGDIVSFSNSQTVEAIETPGHNPGCITYLFDRYLFTGDSYIPGHKVVTKLRGGDRNLSERSVRKIENLLEQNMLLCPGHEEILEAENVKFR